MLDREKIENLKLVTSLEETARVLGLNPHIRRKTNSRHPVCQCPGCGDENHLVLYENFDNLFKPGVVHCLKCGLKGDVITLIKKTCSYNGGQAITWLVKQRGLKVSGFQKEIIHA